LLCRQIKLWSIGREKGWNFHYRLIHLQDQQKGISTKRSKPMIHYTNETQNSSNNIASNNSTAVLLFQKNSENPVQKINFEAQPRYYFLLLL